MLKINVYVQKTKLFINRKKILCSFAVKLGSLLIENCAKWLLINYSCYKIIPQTRKASKFLKNCNYFFSIRWSLFILQSQCANSNFLTKLGDLEKIFKLFYCEIHEKKKNFNWPHMIKCLLYKNKFRFFYMASKISFDILIIPL